MRTIEEDLLVAMRKALAFPAIMENDLKKVPIFLPCMSRYLFFKIMKCMVSLFLSMQLKFQRTARTDKGVSASRQLVSIKMSSLHMPCYALPCILCPAMSALHYYSSTWWT